MLHLVVGGKSVIHSFCILISVDQMRRLGERAMSLTATVPTTNTHQQFKDVCIQIEQILKEWKQLPEEEKERRVIELKPEEPYN
jgi:hypothetical protein